MPDHKQVMLDLARKHDVVVDLIGGKDFHYVDYPLHGNVGDLLIMHGTLEFFRKNHLEPKISAPFCSYSPRWVGKDTVVVFHGGGNLGDIYCYPQELRERVIAACPENRIIILPQTIHFRSEKAWAKCKEVFGLHRDLHVFVRDARSLELARELTPNAYLVPDMAHQLYPMREGKAVGNGVLGIQRVDGESTGKKLGADMLTDWPLFLGRGKETAIRLLLYSAYGFYRLGLGRLTLPALERVWFSASRKIINDAVNLFCAHESVVSDRLHAHILACLLDMPNMIVDNSYGKNSSYIDCWTRSSPLVRLVQN